MEALQSALRRWRNRETLADEELVALTKTGEEAAVRALVKRHNRRLFRIARAVVRDEGESEDIVQETYVRAFAGLDRFRGDAAFSTWLTRIALNEAYGRLRRKRPTIELSSIEEGGASDGGELIMFPLSPGPSNPEAEAGRGQVREMLEMAVDRLPEAFRLVFVLRDVEGLTIDETAALLSVRPETIKTPLFRARRLMRAEVERALSPSFSDVFPFAGRRCADMADGVVERLRLAP